MGGITGSRSHCVSDLSIVGRPAQSAFSLRPGLLCGPRFSIASGNDSSSCSKMVRGSGILTGGTVKDSQPRPLWRNRDFLLLWSGQTISVLGTNISTLALPLLVLVLTHSPALAGLLTAMRLLPYLLFSLPAGALIDRWDRKAVMIRCDIVRWLALGSVPLAFASGYLTVAQLYIVAFIEGTAYVLFSLAQISALPRVVSPTHLPRAYALDTTTEYVGSLLGPGLGGLIISLARTIASGAVLAYLADSISYLASVISLLFIRVPFQAERAVTGRPALHKEIAEGLRFLWQQHPQRERGRWGTGRLHRSLGQRAPALWADHHRLGHHMGYSHPATRPGHLVTRAHRRRSAGQPDVARVRGNARLLSPAPHSRQTPGPRQQRFPFLILWQRAPWRGRWRPAPGPSRPPRCVRADCRGTGLERPRRELHGPAQSIELYSVLEKERQEKESTNSGIAVAYPLQKPPVSHFNCIILVKNSTTFFRTVFFSRAFYILSIEPV